MGLLAGLSRSRLPGGTLESSAVIGSFDGCERCLRQHLVLDSEAGYWRGRFQVPSGGVGPACRAGPWKRQRLTDLPMAESVACWQNLVFDLEAGYCRGRFQVP